MVAHHPTGHDSSAQTEGNPLGLLYIGDVRALQVAETVAFHTRDGRSWIDAGLSTPPAGEPRIYTATEQRLFPDADTLARRRRIVVEADIAGFDERRRWHERQLPGAAAFTVVGAARFDEVWRSVAAFLRVGDVVRLHWHAGNGIDRLVDPQLHRDELSIGIRRGRRCWRFLLDVQVRPGSARMIVRGPDPTGANGRPVRPSATEDEHR